MANAASAATTTTMSNNQTESNDTSDSKADLEEFVRVGRTGRRNAVADVNLGKFSISFMFLFFLISNFLLDPNNHISAASLTEMMRNINCGFEGSSA